MASEWPTVTVGEIAEKVAMGPFGSNIKVETFVPHGVPVISGQHLRGTRLQDGDYNFVSPGHADRLAGANVKRGDVIFTHAGSIGQAAYIPESSRYDRYVISQRQFFVRPDRRRVIPEYLAYYFGTRAGRHQLLANTSSTGVPSIARPVTYLRTLRIPLPPIPEQHRIVGILGALDDKIELNRRMSQTLESMARALFKSWFVDFDPVRAKSEGRDPDLPDEIGSLFPDRFEDSDLGEKPYGWCTTTLGDVSERPQYGFTASAQDQPVGPRFLRITDINKLPWIEWSSVPFCRASIAERQQYGVRPGDIVIARMADPGHGAMVEEYVDSVFASYLIRFRPRDQRYARFLQYWLRSENYWLSVEGHRTGTTRASLNAQVLSTFRLVLPPPALAEAFATQASALRSMLTRNVSESATIAEARDAVLPMLMSGGQAGQATKRLGEALS